MLNLKSVAAGYGRLRVLHDVDLRVESGEIVSLIGANGAGKTTLLRAVSGIAAVTSGRIEFDGVDITNHRPHTIVRRGLVHVPEGRELFGPLTVAENLEMGAWGQPARDRKKRMDEVMELFPILAERRDQVAETMSGGQQQMLAIGRALMSNPRLLMLDEPSIGLAPKMVSAVFDTVQRIRDLGVTVLLVEQNASKAMAISDRVYVIESGSIVLEGPGKDLIDDPRVRRAYLGM